MTKAVHHGYLKRQANTERKPSTKSTARPQAAVERAALPKIAEIGNARNGRMKKAVFRVAMIASATGDPSAS